MIFWAISCELSYRYQNTRRRRQLHDDQSGPRARAATIPRTDRKDMGPHGPQNWRFTVPKTTKMMPVTPQMTSLKMTVRDDCFVSACSPLPTLYKSSHPLLLRGGGVGLWTDVCHPPPCQLPASEIKQTFLSTNLACLLAFEWWAARHPHAYLSVTSTDTRKKKIPKIWINKINNWEKSIISKVDVLKGKTMFTYLKTQQCKVITFPPNIYRVNVIAIKNLKFS